MSMRNLGVYIDGENEGPYWKDLVCLFLPSTLSPSTRIIISSATMQRLVSTFVLSRLDYCNPVLAGLPAVTLKPLQTVMNAANRLVAGLG